MSGGAAGANPSIASGGVVSGSGGFPAAGGGLASGGALLGSGGTGSGGSGPGGAPANGGSNTGTGGSAGSGSGDPCANADILCEDFESLPVGEKPTGGPWLASECFDNSVVLEVDGALGFESQQSLVSRPLPYGACMLHAALGAHAEFWIRARIHWDAGSAFTEHEVTAFELTPDPNVDDPGIRVGFRGDNSCNPTGVEVNITGGSEQTGCTGYSLAPDRWYCFELHVIRQTAGVTTDLFIDGVDQSYSIHGMPADVVTNPDMGEPSHLRVGARSYSGTYPAPVHLDDVAVGTQRIGCQ